jgi:mono/diheme cytochrome c family protein
MAAAARADVTVRPDTVVQDTLGKVIFSGKGTCFACHGVDGKGTPLAPDLTDSTWLHISGTVASIDSLIKAGVAQPKEAALPMLPRAGVTLTDAEVAAVARYVHSLSQRGGQSERLAGSR